MKKLLIFLVMFLVTGIAAQNPSEKPAWNVTLAADTSARSNITVQNRCSGTHSFQIETQNADFLELGQNQVQVAGGQNEVVPVRFNTSGLQPKTYQGQVLVVCLTCSSEPTCTQDREVLPVILNVTPGARPAQPEPKDVPATYEERNPCDVVEEECSDLEAEAARAEAEAAGAKDAADAADTTATSAEAKAKAAEDAATNAEEAAKDDPSDYKANVDGQEYSSADVAYRTMLQNEINRAHAAGEISNEEHEKRTKENTTKKAREERLKNKEKLKKEAEKARKAADEAKAAADEARKAADAAKKAAEDARKAADAARKAYDDCVKKIEEECRKAKEEKERREAEIRAAADREAAAAEAEKKKREAAVRAAAERKEEMKYLLDNIKQLGLIDSSAIGSVPSIWQWLPDWLETPVSMLAEGKSGAPIPTDTLKALGGLYGIVGKLLDPCTAAGKRKTVERLQEMTNPKTNRKYTLNEAIDKTEKMCKLMRQIRAKLQAVQREKERRGIKE